MHIFDTAFAKGILLSLSIAGVTTGGGAVITSARDNAVQDQRLIALESNVDRLTNLGNKLESLDHQLGEANKNIAVLNQQLLDLEKHNGQQRKSQ